METYMNRAVGISVIIYSIVTKATNGDVIHYFAPVSGSIGNTEVLTD